MKKKPTTEQLVTELSRQLDSIEEMTYWSIHATDRFRVGQRVRLSPFGKRRGFRFKGGVTTGKAVKVERFNVTVLVDGYKHPRGYFHGFWEVKP